MYLALLLHLHQPPTQFPKVLKQVTEESYKKIIALLKRYPQVQLAINITASLVEQLPRHGFHYLLKDLSKLSRRGQVEFTASAAYHPLLTKLSVSEIERQIKLNEIINQRYFGETFKPKGFFPPEMAISKKVLRVVSRFGYRWMAVEEQKVQSSKFFKCDNLTLVPRDKEFSLKTAFAQIKTLKDLKSYFLLPTSAPAVLAMDGETFGHHRPEQLGLLRQLFATSSSLSSEYRLVTISELLDLFPTRKEVEVRKSTWGDGWEKWDNPKNPIHRMQWQLTNLAISSVNNSKFKIQNFSIHQSINHQSGRGGKKLAPEQKQWLRARQLLDKALHSDQYWWASHAPYWHYEMVERGARMLRDTVLTVPNASSGTRQKAERLYDKITKTGLELYGDTVVGG